MLLSRIPPPPLFFYLEQQQNHQKMDWKLKARVLFFLCVQFHLECLGLAQLPAADDPSEWFCDRCRHDRQPATAPPAPVLENSSSRAAPKKKKKRTARR
jgi:hypothetical protein